MRLQEAKPSCPPAIEVSGLLRRFGAVEALAHVSLAIRKGEFFSLLGPSGCGKTTLLRIIAGLDLPNEGTLRIGGVSAADIPAHKRPVNTVFQSYALFPHLTVRDNVAFGLRMKRVPPAQIAERVDRVLALVQINDLTDRMPAQLSGGQKQRAALARALVNEPAVLLLDEPLGALDLKLRKQLQVELHEIQRRLGITFIYVTHDQEEALVMSDRIAVMNAGRIEQVDGPQRLYERPRTRFVAQFLGACNLIHAEVVSADADGLAAKTQLGVLRVARVAADLKAERLASDARSADSRRRLPGTGEKVTLAIRPEQIHLVRKDESAARNCVAASIEDVVYSGAETQYRLRAGDQLLNAVLLNAQAGHQGFHPGQSVQCHLPEQALIVLDD